jgi:2-oxoglutarate ferredoxin oxidoreductase subunit alpha
MSEKFREFNWMAGGPQGSGVDSAANVFGRACGLSGLYVFGRREYHSNIKGMHSYFHLRVADHDVGANVNDVDLLAAFDAETVVRHIREVVSDGGIIVDKEQVETDVFGIKPLPSEFKEELRQFLEKQGIGNSLSDLLAYAEKKGITVFRVPYNELLKQIGDQLGISQLAQLTRMTNTLTVAISLALLSYDEALGEKAIETVFGEKAKIAEMNITAHKIAYDYAKDNLQTHFTYSQRDFPRPLRQDKIREKRIFLSGNQAVAVGKVLGGCRVQVYYPITPAADESEYIEAHEILKTRNNEDKAACVVLQTEDEIAAINTVSGAVLAGARAATSTSGPGFALMVEGLAWAGMDEVPSVITYYQRGAPATGLPTRHAQDDLRFAIHAGHGEFARIVLASGDIRECFYDAVKAFNYAEKYQVPVIHLIDKALANTSHTFPYFDTSKVRIERGEILNEEGLKNVEYKRFSFTENGISPRVFLGTRGGIHWLTGDEHNELGHISEEPINRVRMVEKRNKKLEIIDDEVPIDERVNFYGNKDAENMIVSWGSPKGAVVEAVDRLVSEGHSVGFVHVRMVHPLPTEYLEGTLRNAKKVIDVEGNYSGQLGGLIMEKTGIPMNFHILKYNGRPMTTTEVHAALQLILMEKAPKRQVLSYGS